MSLTAGINIRVSPEEKQLFEVQCAEYGKKPAEMLREFIEAFNEDRLRIKRNDSTQSKAQELYIQ